MECCKDDPPVRWIVDDENLKHVELETVPDDHSSRTCAGRGQYQCLNPAASGSFDQEPEPSLAFKQALALGFHRKPWPLGHSLSSPLMKLVNVECYQENLSVQ